MNTGTGILGWILVIFGTSVEYKAIGALLIIAGALIELKDAKK